MRGSLADARGFGHPYTKETVEAGTFKGARKAVRHWREDRRHEQRARAEAGVRLETFAGVAGSDAKGRVLDRREFAVTKDTLQWLSTAQMGWYRNEDRRNTYRPDLLDLLPAVKSLIDVPTDPPFIMKVRKDGQAWYAYRVTPSGLVFGMGANGPPPSTWYYDGQQPPAGFPPGAGWTDFMDEASPEWQEEAQT